MNLITRKRAFATLALAGASALVLAGCGAAPEAEETDSVDFLACAVSDEGNWQDKSFNQAAYEGLLKAEDELGVQIADAESATAEEFEPNLTEMVDGGCDITFAVGFNFSLGGAPVLNSDGTPQMTDDGFPVTEGLLFTFANDHPESHFAWIDGWPGPDNVKAIGYSMNQSSFLAGYLAAAYSTSKVVGTYGGLQIDSVTDFMTGFYNGAKYYEAETGEAITVVGWDPVAKTGDFVGGFSNTAVAQSISEGQIAQGADVLFPVAGSLFTATATAIRDSGTNAVLIGVDKDIALTQPDLADITLTSVEKRMTQAVFDVIKELADGGEFTTDMYIGTLANDGTALSDFYDFDGDVSDEVKAKLEEIKQAIIDGTLDPLATP